MRKLLVFVVILAALAVGLFVLAGRGGAPHVEIASPEKFAGADTPLRLVIGSPSPVESLRVTLEQNGASTEVPIDLASAKDLGDGRYEINARLGKAAVPSMTSGPARLEVVAARSGMWGLRTLESRASRDLTVRLTPPRVTVLSTHHYINAGGAEMVVYRVDPQDVASGVRVGDLEYPGHPASGARGEGVAVSDPALRVAFFALLHDQPVTTPMRVFARDEAGNAVAVDFDRRTFPKAVRQSRIELPDAFLERVVPAILAGTTEVTPTGSTLDKFLVINGDLRRRNNEKIASFAAETSAEMLWGGVTFHPFTNSAVQSAFADQRTYIYQGRDVDKQTHLGFDLASYAGTPIVAANRGKVLFAGELGIYGQTVILDHGMGVQSLYAHLSSIGVAVGSLVEKAQELGRSGMTGMAAGDHLHYTMLVHGRMVNPIEWWDSHWIDDRILRKLRGVK
jgi:murein DD-endopeptidase MepM/ murein hydrolase activator NlpD